MIYRLHLFVFIFLIGTSSLASSPAQFFNFEGTLTDSSNIAVEDSSVSFNVKLFDPAANCVLREEAFTIDMTGSNGQFNLLIGQGTATGDDPGHTFATIFQNTNSISATNGGCPGATYSPTSGDSRVVKVTVTAPSINGGTPETLPSFSLGSVPSAITAETIQGLGKDKLAEFGTHIHANMTAANLLALFDGSDVGSLHNHDSQYAALNSSSSITLGAQQTIGYGQFTNAQESTLTGGLGAGDAGKTWFNTDTNSIMYWDGSSAQAVAVGSSVVSIFGRSGAVTAQSGDYNAGQITNTPSGNIAATDIQSAITELDNEKLALSGGTMSGVINANDNNIDMGTGSAKIIDLADPTNAQDAATKAYVDSAISTNNGSVVLKSGDTMSGSLNMNNNNLDMGTGTAKIIDLADPTNAQDAATKAYVDSQVSASGDGLGTHEATQNIDLNTFKLVGNDGTNGLAIDASGDVGIGTTNPTGLLSLSGDGSDIHHNSYSTSASAKFNFHRARGTEGGELSVQNGDLLGMISGKGWDGSGLQSAARISFAVDGTPGASDMPGRIDFSTTPDGSNSLQTRMTIQEDGKVGIGTTSPTSNLDIASSIKLNVSGPQAQVLSDGANTNRLILGIENDSLAKISIADDGTQLSGFTNNGSIEVVSDNGATSDVMLKAFDDLIFRTGSTQYSSSGATPTMTLHGSGNISIGVDEPSAGLKVDVEGNIGATQYCDKDGTNCFSPSTVSGGVGEVNTASSIGAAGVGVFKQKNGLNFEFKNINTGTGITVTDDTTNNEVDIAVDVGTDPNKIVQLDGSARLPAVDGSQLTGVSGTDSTKLPLAGGTMTGTLEMGGNQIDMGTAKIISLTDPTNAQDAATKNYVDSGVNAKVDKAGDTMTGTLNLPSNGLAVGTNELVVSGNKVGVGTNSPEAALHVVGASIVEQQMLFAQGEGGVGLAAETCSSNSWTKRSLDSVEHNTITGASLASDNITLPAGTYLITASAPYSSTVNDNAIGLFNSSDTPDTTSNTTPLIIGSIEHSFGTDGGGRARLEGVVTLASTTSIAVQHYCRVAGDLGEELSPPGFKNISATHNKAIWTQIKIIKIK